MIVFPIAKYHYTRNMQKKKSSKNVNYKVLWASFFFGQIHAAANFSCNIEQRNCLRRRRKRNIPQWQGGATCRRTEIDAVGISGTFLCLLCTHQLYLFYYCAKKKQAAAIFLNLYARICAPSPLPLPFPCPLPSPSTLPMLFPKLPLFPVFFVHLS